MAYLQMVTHLGTKRARQTNFADATNTEPGYLIQSFVIRAKGIPLPVRRYQVFQA